MTAGLGDARKARPQRPDERRFAAVQPAGANPAIRASP
jgi:hypothetical protein